MAHNEPAIVRDVAKRSTVNEPPLNNTFDSRSSRDLQVLLIVRVLLRFLVMSMRMNELMNELYLFTYRYFAILDGTKNEEEWSILQ